jgi:limonene-1,2-epoxide hydrolase
MKPTRRNALTTASLGLAAFAGPVKAAADWTPAEKANVDAVNAFCATWPSHDVTKIMSFFADQCSYRLVETREPAKGRDAVRTQIASILDSVQGFKVLDTFAKGPMVFNERIDSFVSGPLRSWHGVGVFFLKEGKIVEWYDYTILADRR